MPYSIFDKTMADMKSEEIEQAAKNKACVLFPVAVIEGHGPHMCLGVDTYLTYLLCKKIMDKLDARSKQAILAPPFYWGINHANSGFVGSFTVSGDTMVAMLGDLLICIRKWGFEKIFLVNIHGDYYHNKAILQAARRARQENGIGVCTFLADSLAQACKVTGDEDYVLLFKTQFMDTIDGYIDLHAGAGETGWMVLNFPNLVDIELTRKLKSSRNNPSDLLGWAAGGQKAKKYIPMGYCGDPAQFDLSRARQFEDLLVEEMSNSIASHLENEQ
jgi:creatinine amidohydrolase